MGWYDTFRGHTERINVGSYGSDTGSAARNFGNAFRDIGKTIIDAQAQKDRSRLIDLQVQNEQNKLDTHKDAQAQKKLDDAFKADISTLEAGTSEEARQNAVDALQAFHKPSYEAKTQGDQNIATRAKAAQEANDKSYLSDAFTLDLGASKEARANADEALRQFYAPQTQAVKEIETRFKAADDLAQTRFNDEAIEVSVSGGYKDMASFTKANPELVKNADGLTMAKIETFYANKAKDAADRADKDRTYELNKRKTDNEIYSTTEQLKIAKTKAAAGDGDAGEKDSKVVDAINKIITTKYGKADPMSGLISISADQQAKADWLGTRALQYVSQGHNASTAFVKAERDYGAAAKNSTKKKQAASDPLGLRQP